MKSYFVKSILILGASAITKENDGTWHSYSEDMPSFYDVTSGHSGPTGHLIPEHFRDPVSADRMMHHLIRYYGRQEMGKCNTDKELEEGESRDDWKKPVNFVGEFPDCNKPTGRIWLFHDQAIAAGKEAVKEYYGYNGEKLDQYCNEHLNSTWNHFDVNKDGKVEIERGHQYLRMVLGNVDLAYGVQ